MNFSANPISWLFYALKTPMCALHTDSISARLNQRCSSVTPPTVHIFHAACGVSPSKWRTCLAHLPVPPPQHLQNSAQISSCWWLRLCASSVGKAGSILGQGRKIPHAHAVSHGQKMDKTNSFSLGSLPLPPTVFQRRCYSWSICTSIIASMSFSSTWV